MIAPSHNVVTAKLLTLCGSISGTHKWDVSGSASLTSPPIRPGPAVLFSFSLLCWILSAGSRVSALQTHFVEFISFCVCVCVCGGRVTCLDPDHDTTFAWMTRADFSSHWRFKSVLKFKLTFWMFSCISRQLANC